MNLFEFQVQGFLDEKEDFLYHCICFFQKLNLVSLNLVRQQIKINVQCFLMWLSDQEFIHLFQVEVFFLNKISS